ncbi:MAG: GNAT family N-acetyltransferase [Corynebacteriales bacterium]|nr:GNAT family N-acetyltransferase [Mycobacteriales bacterium]
MIEAKTHRLGSAEAKNIVDELLKTYIDVYAVPPYVDDPFFSAAAAAARVNGALDMPGFEVLTARHEGTLIGFVFGVTLTPDKPWWASHRDDIPDKLAEAVRKNEIFWLRELLVVNEWRDRGVGRHLHDTLISGRPESMTVLTCISDNQPAHAAYLRWGYTIFARIKHAPESPIYDAMLLAPH